MPFMFRQLKDVGKLLCFTVVLICSALIEVMGNMNKTNNRMTIFFLTMFPLFV